ncbi:hypothetical protein G7075_06605 [Phycicoccus sp. HDW14]|uniref:hypothetical protein n=1 Tax=Phycicoccus sp. HDW14 TaxID=2714941 RepID=UPI001407B09E|nr:hypothetical protein [Phycicoccus sp. HDW14]QIM20880.1 hypothetical protein G7075_06605 [Phycicoccus sp. HDW14]
MAKFWIGVAVGVFGAPVLVVGGLLLLATLTSGPDAPGTAVAWVAGAVLVALVVAGLVVRATRWVVLGAVAGGAVVVIVLGGACVALIRGLGG